MVKLRAVDDSICGKVSSFCTIVESFVFLQGFGMLLMEEAERIAKDEHGSSKIVVISGTLFSVRLRMSYFSPSIIC